MKIKAMLQSAGIGWYRSVLAKIGAKQIKKGDICYVASTPQCHGYGGYRANTTRAYIWTGDGVELLFSDLSNHRAKQAIRHYSKYRNGQINPEVWHNYITGGYHTRRGLLADYDNAIRSTLKRIAQSHADYLGNEVDSTTDHQARMRLRRRR